MQVHQVGGSWKIKWLSLRFVSFLKFHHCDGRKNMVSFPSGFETETKARRHITMLFVGSLEARTKFWRKIRPFEHVVPIERGQGWSPVSRDDPQSPGPIDLFLPLHHHHVAHQSRTRALMDLKMRWTNVWNDLKTVARFFPYYHWDLLKCHLHFLISNDIVNCQHEAIMLDLSWPRHCCHSMSRWYWEVTCSNPARRGCCQQICPVRNPRFVARWHTSLK